jgi:hypothetical protein
LSLSLDAATVPGARTGSSFLDELNTGLAGDMSYTAVYTETDEVMRTFFWGCLPGMARCYR